jgi:hypothetical protein
MVPPESLSQYLSNEYQCYGVSKVIQVYIEQEFEFRASRHLKLVRRIAARHWVISVLI